GDQAARLKPHLPPASALLRQLRSELLPDAALVIFAGIGHREIAEGTKHRFNAFQFRAAVAAILQVRGDFFARCGIAVLVSDQLFFRWMIHPSVPITLACGLLSRNGSRAWRSF